MRLFIATLSLAALATAGCGGEDPFARPQRDVNTGAFGVAGGVDELAAEPAGKSANDTAEAGDPEEVAAPKPPPPTPPMKKAEVGVGKKGHYGGPGIIKTPISIYFSTRERIAFNVQIPKAMQIYKAMNNNKGPATHEEFMEKIIKANQVKLPDLLPGDSYIYDPEKEELFIEERK
jgi:hypothetical protein